MNRIFSKRVCSFPKCLKEYTPKSATHKFCGEVHFVKCLRCQENVVEAKTLNYKPECKTCRKKLQQERFKSTMVERHGATHPSKIADIQEAKKKKALEKYGVENISQAKEIKEAKKLTALEKYGVENISQAEEIKEAKRQSYIKKYGVDNPQKSPEIKAKTEATMLDRYGAKNPLSSNEIKAKVIATNQEKYSADWFMGTNLFFERARVTNLDRYGTEYPQELDFVKEKQAKTFEETMKTLGASHPKISRINKEWAALIKSRFNGEVSFEAAMGVYSIDLKVNDSLLVEINPTISHNSFRPLVCTIKKCSFDCSKHKKFSKNTHYEKAQCALENNLSLIQVFDWDGQDAITKLIAGKVESGYTKHSARKLELKKINQREANKFLAEYHIQGPAKKQSHCYGLYREGELLAVATFGPGRFKTKAEYEWIRYAVKQGHIIHGASSKLWRAFHSETQPKSVISYVDFNHTTAPQTFLHIVGFTELKPTGPQLMWSKGGKRIYNNSLLAQGADRLLGTSYGRPEVCGLNNKEIMLLEGWLPVYTAGNRVFWWENG